MTRGLFECFSLVYVKNKEENKKIFITALPVYQITQILTDYMCWKKFKSQQNGY